MTMDVAEQATRILLAQQAGRQLEDAGVPVTSQSRRIWEEMRGSLAKLPAGAHIEMPPGLLPWSPAPGGTVQKRARVNYCEQGHKHRGPGAAGVLIRAPRPDGTMAYLLQQRNGKADEPLTWGVFGGTLHQGEQPRDGAKRELEEETGIKPDAYDIDHKHTDDHGGWAYTTYVAGAPETFWPSFDGKTPDENANWGWFTPEEMSQLDLHPSFKEQLPSLIRTEKREKVSKASVHYREATDDRQCFNCVMFHSNSDSCDLVLGHISAEDVCDRWEAKPAEKARRVVGLNGQETWDDSDAGAGMYPAAGGGAMMMPPVPGGVPGSTAGGEPPRWDGSEVEPRVASAPDDADDAQWPAEGRVPSPRPGTYFPAQYMDGYWPLGGHGTGQAGQSSPGGDTGIPPSTVRAKKRVSLPDLVKVGPEGYIHGFICVRPPCGPRYAEMDHDTKTGKVHGGGRLIGRQLKKEAGDHGYSIAHVTEDGKKAKLGGQYATRHEAAKAVATYHDIDVLHSHAPQSVAKYHLGNARRAMSVGDHDKAVSQLDEAAKAADDPSLASHITHVRDALNEQARPMPAPGAAEPKAPSVPKPEAKLPDSSEFQPTHTGVYHASANYEKLRAQGFTGRGGAGDEAYYGAGTYFSTDKNHADQILGNMQYTNDNVGQVRADVSLHHPFRIETTQDENDPSELMHRSMQQAGLKPSYDPEQITRELKRAGYDGVEIHQSGSNVGMAGGSQVLVFDNKQIRVRPDLPAKDSQARAMLSPGEPKPAVTPSEPASQRHLVIPEQPREAVSPAPEAPASGHVVSDVSQSEQLKPGGAPSAATSEKPPELKAPAPAPAALPMKTPVVSPGAPATSSTPSLPARTGNELWSSDDGKADLTKQQEEAIGRIWYSGGYMETARLLRSGKSFYTGDQKTQQDNDIATLKSAIARSKPMSQDATVYRDISDPGEIFGDKPMAPGHVFTDKSFVSTTADRSYVEGFSSEFRKDRAIITIDLPKGTKALRPTSGILERVRPKKNTVDPAESKEFTLPPGTRFHVVSHEITQETGFHGPMTVHRVHFAVDPAEQDFSGVGESPRLAALDKPLKTSDLVVDPKEGDGYVTLKGTNVHLGDVVRSADGFHVEDVNGNAGPKMPSVNEAKKAWVKQHNTNLAKPSAPAKPVGGSPHLEKPAGGDLPAVAPAPAAEKLPEAKPAPAEVKPVKAPAADASLNAAEIADKLHEDPSYVPSDEAHAKLKSEMAARTDDPARLSSMYTAVQMSDRRRKEQEEKATAAAAKGKKLDISMMSGGMNEHLSPAEYGDWKAAINDSHLSFPDPKDAPWVQGYSPGAYKAHLLDTMKYKSAQSVMTKAGVPEAAARAIAGWPGSPPGDQYMNAFPNMKSSFTRWAASGNNAGEVSTLFDRARTMSAPDIRESDWNRHQETVHHPAEDYPGAKPWDSTSWHWDDKSPEADQRRNDAAVYWGIRAQQHYTNQVLAHLPKKKQQESIPVVRMIYGKQAAALKDAVSRGESWQVSTRTLSSWSEPNPRAKKSIQAFITKSSMGKDPMWLEQEIAPSQVFAHWRGEGTLRNSVKVLGEVIAADSQVDSSRVKASPLT